ncbi:hypothetical protein FCL40_17330 [Ferrimonas sediminicola]|uniref:PH domain-containing protein n=1 Tax=Ferrimonas sediminicola TaxID=2569538 RepID=A0A4U1B837_9GAMM|nr:hypothetical protein [Ferrimonas sediminicola]TKB46815.1 hypothetical protein FCL40_17330 [Ferrimonas sediminicola]
MGALYRRTQFSGLMVSGLTALMVTLWWVGCDSPATLLLCALVLLVGGLLISLTIEVHPGFLRWYFGPRVWRRQLSLSEIDQVSVIGRSEDGRWPIHLGRSGWVYQVSGHYAVELRLHCGKIIRLGTDNPYEVVNAIRQHQQCLS